MILEEVKSKWARIKGRDGRGSGIVRANYTEISTRKIKLLHQSVFNTAV